MKKLFVLIVLLSCTQFKSPEDNKNNFVLSVASNPALFDSLIVNDDFSINFRKKIKDGIEDDKYILNKFISCYCNKNYYLYTNRTGLSFVFNSISNKFDTIYRVTLSCKNIGNCLTDTIEYPYLSINFVWEKIDGIWEFNGVSSVDIPINKK